MAGRRWRVRLGAAAEVDFANILRWTTENFGARQSRSYRDTLVQAMGELADVPMLRAPGRGTRSWQTFARFTWRGTAVAEAIS
ncbi:plasmid stabilization system protein ParE [Bradyrhizobium sp. CIR3A]|nr:plasmid stabilization system protein ParE [Bradyrhizobium sp. CIR3A]MBB4395947.1 plasmid stabilization system protein ParE [Bradyrhizobium sp. ERR14]NYG48999.1 plasmid stabilization system protein ParE [Bradyrhizobium sp. IAR9]